MNEDELEEWGRERVHGPRRYIAFQGLGFGALAAWGLVSVVLAFSIPNMYGRAPWSQVADLVAVLFVAGAGVGAGRGWRRWRTCEREYQRICSGQSSASRTQGV